MTANINFHIIKYYLKGHKRPLLYHVKVEGFYQSFDKIIKF